MKGALSAFAPAVAAAAIAGWGEVSDSYVLVIEARGTPMRMAP